MGRVDDLRRPGTAEVLPKPRKAPCFDKPWTTWMSWKPLVRRCPRALLLPMNERGECSQRPLIPQFLLGPGYQGRRSSLETEIGTRMRRRSWSLIPEEEPPARRASRPLCLPVQDRGRGVPPGELQPRLKEPGFRPRKQAQGPSKAL